MANTHPAPTMISPAQKPALKRTDSGIDMGESASLVHTSSISPSLPTTIDKRGSTQMLLNEAIMTRHSTRLFLPTPVPHSLLEHALEVATYSPSNSNTQAWRLFIVTGTALTRLTSVLVHSASQGDEPNIPGLPATFNTYRSALGKQVYGEGYGLARDDIEGRKAATLRNFDFFGAPVGIVVCMSSELFETEALSVGMYVQTLLLALTERGLASCVEISIAGYPDLVKREVGIPEDLMVLCGIAVGYEDGDAGVNKIRSKREVVDKTTVWVGE